MKRTIILLSLAVACAMQLPAVRASRSEVAMPAGRLSLLGQHDPGAKPKQPADAPESREDTVQRLRRTFDDTLGRIERDDAGSATQELQRKILQDLDRLIKQSDRQEHPPVKPPSNLIAKPESPGAAPQAKSAPKSATGQPNPGAAKAAKLPTTQGLEAWEPWLPLRKLPGMDTYAGDEPMPKYEELLRRYYRAIADESLRKAP